MSVQLHRAIDLLELIEAADHPLALGEIAEKLDLPKPAAHRLLQVWVKRGYLEQEPATLRYVATLRLAIIGFRHLAATGIRDVCYPELNRLASETGELARLAVAEGESLTWIVEAQGARAGLRYDGNLGREAILHATAAGKAWLSTLPEEEAVRLVLQQGFRGPDETGPMAINTVDELLAALRLTRARGYATAIEEAVAGVSAVAAPVYDNVRNTGAVGSIIIVGPSARLSPAQIERYVPLLFKAAERVGALWPVRSHTIPARFEASERGAA